MRNESCTRLLRMALALCTIFVGGCGDDPSGASTELDGVETRGAAGGLEGRTVYLRRDSTRCGSPPSNPLVAVTGTGVEFPSDQTRQLESPCGEAPSPGIEVSVDGASLIFDFSNVDQADAFPSAEFEGYELSFARRCGDPVLAAISLDAEQSTFGITEVEVSHHYDSVRVDFEQLAYDHASFLKVDLELVDVDCAGTSP